ncbi:hypothetical protein HYFRA_00012013 [Hymenoscyphus fraxineus]|uniref:Uncharacterized protein n=1 Tax=Hymenoscyphus fraxineus TaxID=746836 RepID=A0A9N9PWU1_9HELO|nr:hypothetical protein HYFRA_00012013 [Hymenoscyphus fraxineus]
MSTTTPAARIRETETRDLFWEHIETNICFGGIDVEVSWVCENTTTRNHHISSYESNFYRFDNTTQAQHFSTNPSNLHLASTFLLAIAALFDTTTAQTPDIFQGSAHLDNVGGGLFDIFLIYKYKDYCDLIQCQHEMGTFPLKNYVVNCDAPDALYAVAIDWVDFDLPLSISIITPYHEPYDTTMIPLNKKRIVGPTGFENFCEFGFKLDEDYFESPIEGDPNLSPDASNDLPEIPLC